MSILQGDEEDKAWQISHMFEIYRRSTAIILPGGVQRLVAIDEATSWMDRAWTLQEAIAPLFPFVLWKPSSEVVAHTGNCGVQVRGLDSYEQPFECPVCFVKDTTSSPHPRVICFLRRVLEGSIHEDSVQRTPFGWTQSQQSHVIGAQGLSQYAPFMDIWSASWMRTSSRAKDVVLSIMQFEGVSLDSRKFHRDDRVGAMIALLQTLQKPEQKSFRMRWFFSLCLLPPSREYSLFPIFPLTSKSGCAMWPTPDTDGSPVRIVDYCDMLGNVESFQLPFISMNPKYHDLDSPDYKVLYDDAGYLHITKVLYPVYLLDSDAHPPDGTWDDHSKLVLKDVSVYSGKFWELQGAVRPLNNFNWSQIHIDTDIRVSWLLPYTSQNWQPTQQPHSIYASRFGRISRYNNVTRNFLEIDVFIILQSDGENRYRRISAATSMYPVEQRKGPSSERVDTLTYSRQHLSDAAVNMRIGGPVAYKRQRCPRHHDREYLIEQCDNCQWASSPML